MRTSDFNCPVFDPIYQNIKASYKGEHKYDAIVSKGGSASGKSQNIAHNMIFWLPEVKGHEALIILYGMSHKNNTVQRIINIMNRQEIPYNIENTDDKKTLIKYGNNNKITIMGIKAGSKEEIVEKLKTFETENPLKFIWFEEFTAILYTFDDASRFRSGISRLYRTMDDNGIIFYTFNPPKLTYSVFYEWLETFEGLTVHSTMYDLPGCWVSERDIKEAERLKRTNKQDYNDTVMGIPSHGNSNAFVITDDIYTEPAKDYVEFYIHTDEATRNATTFGLFGYTADGDYHLIDLFYHSSKMDGIMYSQGQYAKMFIDWSQEFISGVSRVVTDGLIFRQELVTRGIRAQSMGEAIKKDRKLSYTLLEHLINKGRFKVLRNPNNEMMVTQLRNAKKEYDAYGFPMVSKKDEAGKDNAKHLHCVDLALYLCLIEQNNII